MASNLIDFGTNR